MKRFNRANRFGVCAIALALLAVPILGGDCDDGGSSGVLDIILAVVDLVLGIIEVAS